MFIEDKRSRKEQLVQRLLVQRLRELDSEGAERHYWAKIYKGAEEYSQTDN